MNSLPPGFKTIPFDPVAVDCTHGNWELRRRTKSNGWSGLFKQCVDCGGLAAINTIGKAKAAQAHHVTYDHFGSEFLFELLAVCEPCHTRIHSKDNEV